MTPVPVDNLHARYGTDLASIVQFSFPFSKAGRVLLVVLSANAKKLWWAYEELWQADVRDDGVLCLRTSELRNLGLPGPVVTTASMPYWLRETCQILYGADVSHRVSVTPRQGRLLSYHLDRVRSSRHRLLEFLIRKDYEALDAYLAHERRSVMYASLFSQDQWRVFPDTLDRQFMATCAITELQENMVSAAAVSEELKSAPGPARRELAYRSVWLFEQFLLGLSRCVP
jgi:hypothetical protein